MSQKQRLLFGYFYTKSSRNKRVTTPVQSFIFVLFMSVEYFVFQRTHPNSFWKDFEGICNAVGSSESQLGVQEAAFLTKFLY